MSGSLICAACSGAHGHVQTIRSESPQTSAEGDPAPHSPTPHTPAPPPGRLPGVAPAHEPRLTPIWQSATVIRSTPRWSGARMVVASTGGVLHGLASDSLPSWTRELGAEVVGLASDGRGGLRVTTLDGRVIALSDQGDLLWSHDLGSPAGSAAVVAADGSTYALANGLHAIGADGQLLWHVPRVGAVRAGPTLAGDLITFGTDHGEIVAVDAAGSTRWSVHVGASVDSPPAPGPQDDILVGTDLGHLHSISGSGDLRWSTELGGRITAAPTTGPLGQIAVVSSDYSLYYLDRNGNLLWRFRTGAALRARPTIDATGAVLLSGRDNTLYQIDHTGQSQWQTNVGHPIGTPVVASPDGRLYVATDDAQLLTLQERKFK